METEKMSETRVWRIHSRVAFQKVEEGFFVITPDNALHQLNDSVSIRIWEALEGEGAPVDLLVQIVTEEFEVSADVAKNDIQEFLAGALKREMVEIANA
jgi:hypothetical protein